jgi:hypothetical protein
MTYLLFCDVPRGLNLLFRYQARTANFPQLEASTGGPRGLPLIGDVRRVSDNKWLASPQRSDR